MPAFDLSKLPTHAVNGHYWFGKHGTCEPAILLMSDGKHYMLSTPDGVPFDGAGNILTFGTPEEALTHLRKIVPKK